MYLCASRARYRWQVLVQKGTLSVGRSVWAKISSARVRHHLALSLALIDHATALVRLLEYAQQPGKQLQPAHTFTPAARVLGEAAARPQLRCAFARRDEVLLRLIARHTACAGAKGAPLDCR